MVIHDIPQGNTILPASNPTLPFWRTKLDKLDESRTTPDLPRECEIAIIGAGYAGASTAYHIITDPSYENKKPSVVILEARQACSGATGRNGGHLRPSYGQMQKYTDRYGIAAAAEVVDFEYTTMAAMKEVIYREKIDCDFVFMRSLDVFIDAEAAEKATKQYDKLVEAKVKFIDDWHCTYGPSAEGLSGVKGAKACLSSTAGAIWPYKFVLHLLTRAVAAGVNLQTFTPVISVSDETDSAGRYTINTPRGKLLARKVIYTSNGYTAGLLAEYSPAIFPCRGICCRIVVPDPTNVPLLQSSMIIRVDPKEACYLIPRSDDGSIIVGGAYKPHIPIRNSWFNTTDDETLIEPSKDYFDGYMQRTFKGWEKSGAHVDKIWTGVMGYTSDSLPHVGAVHSRPNQFIASGFNGHGMPVIYLVTKGIAQMVLHDRAYDKLGIPRLYETSAERLHVAKEGPLGGNILA